MRVKSFPSRFRTLIVEAACTALEKSVSAKARSDFALVP